MLNESLISIFERDLKKLKQEITAYRDESKLWATVPGINNSAGNLCLHITGNLQHFIGAVMGETGYERDRSKEFNRKDVPMSTLLGDIGKTASIIKTTLQPISDEDMEKRYPIDVLHDNMKTGFFLIHLAAHLNYHLGQINYHRRLVGR